MSGKPIDAPPMPVHLLGKCPTHAWAAGFDAAVSALTAAQQQGQAMAWPTEAKQAGSGDWEARTSLCAHTMSEAQARAWNACLAACKAANTAPPPSVPVELAEAVRAFWRGYNAASAGAGGRQQGRTAAGVAAVLSLAQQPAAVDGACAWSIDTVDESWDGACGAKWQFTNGGPDDNDMRHCPQCGKRIATQHQGPES